LQLRYEVQIAVFEIIIWTDYISVEFSAVEGVDLVIHPQNLDSEVVLACESWVVDVDENVQVLVETEVHGFALVVSAVRSAELVVARVEPHFHVLLVEQLEQVVLHTLEFNLNHFEKVLFNLPSHRTRYSVVVVSHCLHVF
jgi:hypothetical protein